MDKNLVFDVGTNDGEDALFYVSKGYKVIAIDADLSIVEQNRSRIKTSDITFLHCAVSDTDNLELDFYINQDDAKNSLIAEVGDRDKSLTKVIKVKTRTLKSLMEQYGVPYYCKIDIEGYDPVALRSMKGLPELPVFISAEGECKPDSEKFSEEGVLDTLEALRELGYTKFKLVDQTTLYVLDFNDYFIQRTHLSYKIIRKLQKMTGLFSRQYTNKQRVRKKYNYPFAYDTTGPFGEELEGEWINYEDAKRLYLYHRRAFFSKDVNKPFTFWVDWHATR